MANEIDRLNRILNNNKRQFDQVEGRDKQYLAEIERLNNTLRLKVEESSYSQIKENDTRSEIERMKRQLDGTKSQIY